MRRGVTLVEVLLTGLLFGVTLAVVGSLLLQYSRSMRHTDRKDMALEGALTLQAIASEAEEAVDVSSPSPGNASAALTFTRIDPSYPDRLPTQRFPVPSPVPAAWEPQDPAYLVTVTYQLNGKDLERLVTLPGPAQSRQVVAANLNGFTVSRTLRQLSLRGQFQEAQQVRDVTLLANLKTGPWP